MKVIFVGKTIKLLFKVFFSCIIFLFQTTYAIKLFDEDMVPLIEKTPVYHLSDFENYLILPSLKIELQNEIAEIASQKAVAVLEKLPSSFWLQNNLELSIPRITFLKSLIFIEILEQVGNLKFIENIHSDVNLEVNSNSILNINSNNNKNLNFISSYSRLVKNNEPFNIVTLGNLKISNLNQVQWDAFSFFEKLPILQKIVKMVLKNYKMNPELSILNQVGSAQYRVLFPTLEFYLNIISQKVLLQIFKYQFMQKIILSEIKNSDLSDYEKKYLTENIIEIANGNTDEQLSHFIKTEYTAQALKSESWDEINAWLKRIDLNENVGETLRITLGSFKNKEINTNVNANINAITNANTNNSAIENVNINIKNKITVQSNAAGNILSFSSINQNRRKLLDEMKFLSWYFSFTENISVFRNFNEMYNEENYNLNSTLKQSQNSVQKKTVILHVLPNIKKPQIVCSHIFLM